MYNSAKLAASAAGRAMTWRRIVDFISVYTVIVVC
jgi:hypothetical protein